MATTMNKKKKFVADGVFYAELNELLTRELAEEGYSGVEVRNTPMRVEIIIRATRTQNVLGEKGRRIRELTSVVQKRFKFKEGTVELYAEKVANKGLCAVAQAESLRYKLLGGLAVRRACYGVLRFIMESNAKGCEVIVSGKLRAQRAKAMKFKDGYMISSGGPVREYIDSAVRHVMLRQGVLGIKVKIMLPHDASGKAGVVRPLPDQVTIHTPKDEDDALFKPVIGKEAEALLALSRPPSSPRLSKLATPLILSLLLLLHHSPLISAATTYGGVLPAANTLASPYSLHNGWFVFWLCTYNEDADTGEVSFTPFWFNGFQEDFPSPMDAALPPLGFYAVNGNCEYMVDSSCNIVQKDLECDGCCYLNPRPAMWKQVTCFGRLSEKCNYRIAPLSGTCGEPANSTINCNVCNFSS
ncbi:unnamed protein product [Closterium sp. NIES-64]|nr:unnamed protein product [Closterium sp. NIES-64]